MPSITANGITLEYESLGPDDAPPMVLIMGLGLQMTSWPEPFLARLVARGFRVIRFDNRDTGLSQKFDGQKAPSMLKMRIGGLLKRTPKVPYQLTDMADDTVGLLDALGLENAHVVGLSMGGMIGQLMALHHADRVQSFTSIMSTTGDPRLPTPNRKVMWQVFFTRPKTDDEEAVIEHGLKVWKLIGSPAYPLNEDRLRESLRLSYRRMRYPQGFRRHTSAIVASGNRAPLLKNITTPTLVIHGAEDPLVPVQAGWHTAASIPNARYEEIPGMGHNLPEQLYDTLTDLIADHAHAHG